MSTARWIVVILSFAAAIGVSLYIVSASWSAGDATVTLPLGAHLLAVAAVVGEVSTRASKLCFSARALRIPLRFRTAVRTCLGGDFGASITPSRSGSEPGRFMILAQDRLPVVGVLLILFLELFLEMLSLAAIVGVLAIVFHGSGRVVGGLVGVVGGYAVFVLGGGAAAYALSRRSANGPPPRWASWIWLHAGRWRAIQRALRQLRSSVHGLRDADVGLMMGAMGFSIVHVLLRLAILPVLVLAVAPETTLAPLLLWPLALLYGGAAAPAPAGGGLIEFTFKMALGGVIPAAVFGAALVWWRFYTFYLYLVLGALAAGGTVLRALRGTDEELPAGEEATAA
ncbi:MAG TPA: lysylphosphatidylglycerol synthase domain-containing protein [Gemmatimonadaceae bacterium]|nr:lysylphosphatidylglycerol synthase domain-containing protein [Gemmatimonadaceae bacterium]